MFRLAAAVGANSTATTCADDVTTIAVVGCGATGSRAARQLSRRSAQTDVVLVDDSRSTADSVARAIGASAQATIPEDASLVILAVRGGDHVGLARQCVNNGQHVVSVADAVNDVRDMLELHADAKANDVTVAVGAGMMPGLTDILVRHAAEWLDDLHEVHVAKFGTGGPDCARQHHRALKGLGLDWRSGAWTRRPGGSGRDLAWFPEPVQSADCYRAALADPVLIVRAHPGVKRVTARMAATRRDRLTMHMPMLRQPHPEGLLGAVRVDVRGVSEGRRAEYVLGCSERPAVAAGTVAAASADQILTDRSLPAGAFGIGELFDPVAFLHDLRARGLRPELFVGSGTAFAF